MPLVKFPSHRMREHASVYIADMKSKARYSLRVSTGYGVYDVTDTELETLKARRKQPGPPFYQKIRFSVVRKGVDTFMHCWS